MQYKLCKGCEAHTHPDKLVKGRCPICHDEYMENAVWRKVKIFGFAGILVLVMVIGLIGYFRGAGMWDCQWRQWEENRETEFTLWRGRCLYVLADGRRIPVNQSRTQTTDQGAPEEGGE